MATELFVVTRQGVYRHEIGGIFDTLEQAFEWGRLRLIEETDNYHHYEVRKRTLNQEPELVEPKPWGKGWGYFPFADAPLVGKIYHGSEDVICERIENES